MSSTHASVAPTVALLLTMTACSAHRAPPREEPTLEGMVETTWKASRGGVARSSHVVRGVELNATPVNSLYEALQRTRPEILRPRVARGVPPGYRLPPVYLNGFLAGGVETLNTIPLRVVAEVRYIGEIEARTQFPGPHPVGAILVTTRRD